MKSLIVYSSQTGNTKKLAEAAGGALPDGAVLSTTEEAPDPSQFDLVVLGFWLMAGKPDPKSQAYLERLKGHKKLFLFATHGARPGSEHSDNAMVFARSMVENANIIGTFCSYGEASEKILAKAGSKPHPPAWLADAPNAIGHPDQTDMDNLRAAIQAALS